MSIIEKYGLGLKYLLEAMLTILIWEVLVFIPIAPLLFLFPDQFEGKADGSLFVRLIVVAICILWGPIAFYIVGPISLSYKSNNDEKKADHLE